MILSPEFYRKTVINLGASKLEIDIHINAPVVINFYTQAGGRKKYNRDQRSMKYASGNGEDIRDTMNRLHGNRGRTYYIATE